MLDVRLLRAEPDAVRAALERRGEGDRLAPVLALDAERRSLQTRVDELRARRNAASEQVGQALRRAREDPEAAATAERAKGNVREAKEELGRLEDALALVDERFEASMLALSNLPDPSAPPGNAEEDAEIVKLVGEPPSFDFEPRDHLQLAGAGIDMERGARTSGSRFGYLTGDVARLWTAIARLALDLLVAEGFTLVIPPVLVRREALVGTGMIPEAEDQIYRVEADDLYLVGTAEVPLASLHAGEILDEAELPVRYCGISSCFRREAGAAGRDTRGIFRTHQFEKVEMFAFTGPERSSAEHERMLAIEERLAGMLGLHYQVVNIAAGDLGASAAKKYDLEVWLPGQGRYRELTSCSNCTDFQARRLNARFRPQAGGAPQVLHTLNGTAATSSRTVIAVLETHQQADGSVAVPEPLQELGAPRRIGPR